MPERKYSVWHISPITKRILAVNIVALLILGIGLLYSGEYERELIKGELSSMHREGRLLAAALAESGYRENKDGEKILAEDLCRHMLRKLSEENGNRIILFARNGDLMLDSHQLLGPGGIIEITDLAPPFSSWSLKEKAEYIMARGLALLPFRLVLPAIKKGNRDDAQGYPFAVDALKGGGGEGAWKGERAGEIILTSSVPVQSLKTVMGAVFIMNTGTKVDEAVKSVQLTVLRLFGFSLIITLLFSVYLSETIARPILRLASAAHRVKQSLLFKDEIPDLKWRRDEIGLLSSTLRDMTTALSDRIDAISNFAADVAHEIRNPLASAKSAAETLVKIEDPEKRKKLASILIHDIERINRLISDISAASRIDSETMEAEKSPIDIAAMIKNMISTVAPKTSEKIIFKTEEPHIWIRANSMQIERVLQNLISNALSFVTEQGNINISITSQGDRISLSVENDGPAIPDAKLETIFNRFYTLRPEGEKFGEHSGLGLSISRQIIRAHHGVIYAENIKNENGTHKGVRFTIIIPKG